MLVYDLEIARAVQMKGDKRLDGVDYCGGWTDFAGMGIASLVAYDLEEARFRVFMQDNLLAFQDLVNARSRVIGFNSLAFDNRVCEAAGIVVPAEKSLDLARLIWKAAGIPEGEHPKGFGLDAICQANKLGAKSGQALMAPVMFQRGDIGGLLDYNIEDVRLTLRLYRLLATAGGCIDPRNGEWLKVVVPR